MDGLISKRSATERLIIAKTLLDSVLQDMPTAEPRKGKWITDVAYYDENGCPCIVTRCSECGEPSPESNYCPNCGARMGG